MYEIPEEGLLLDRYFRPATYQKILDLIGDASWKFGWKTSNNVPEYVFNCTYVKCNRGDTRDIQDELPNDTLRLVWKILKEEFELKKLLRCYANLTVHGVDAYPHVDVEEDDVFTFVIYICDQWDIGFGGSTLLYDRDTIIRAVSPKPNRMLVFHGKQLHSATSVTRMCSLPRITLMFKASK